jgi:hypothetical protein
MHSNSSPFKTSNHQSFSSSFKNGNKHQPIVVLNNTNGHHVEKAKRHYNSEVDPARYRKVLEEGITKFACSICGNTYKWRKSLNKHWKEKHITETPPPLDAPVTVKLRNGSTTINCIATANGSTLQLPAQQNNTSSSSSSSHQFKKLDSSFGNFFSNFFI